MPIIGMMPETENVFAGLPRIAKLRKGAPKEQRKRKDGTPYEVVGRDLDHLRVVFDPEYVHLQPIFTRLYGKQPKEFTAFLNADTVADAFDFWKEEWTATTMLTRCDGQNKHIWFNQDSGRYMSAKVPCDVKCGCKAVGRLNLILPAFTMETGVMGYFTIETHSEEDIRTLYARIVSIWATFGKLRGIPLIMCRAPRKMSVPEVKDNERTGKRMNKTMHMLDIRVDPEYTKEHLLAALTTNHRQLPAPPVSTLTVPSTQQSIRLLGNGGSRRLDTSEPESTNGNEAHTEEQPETPKPPAWLNHANRASLVTKAKSDKLLKSGDFDDLLKLADMTEIDCYPFETGALWYAHAKELIQKKQIVSDDGTNRKKDEPAITDPEAQSLLTGNIPADEPLPSNRPSPFTPEDVAEGMKAAANKLSADKTQQRSFGIAPGQTSFVPPSRQTSARMDLNPKGQS